MSDPRMIPADEARRWKRILDVAGTTGGLGYRHWLTIVALYEQVERQAAQIERIQAALKQAHEDEFIAGLDRYPTVVYTAPEGDEWVEDYPVLLPGDMEVPT